MLTGIELLILFFPMQTKLKSIDIITERLNNHHLVNPDFLNVEEVVGWLGAVQSQDFAGAKWSLALRMKNAVDKEIEKVFNEGKILRTHIMRPTWHFVLPDDIYWLLKLTAPRIKTILGHYDKKLELNDTNISKCKNIIAKALQGKIHLTREEISKELSKHKIEAKGQRLAHIVMHAEIDAVICSGPMKGKQFTYALFNERVRNKKNHTKGESLSKLATKYFQSHGPATVNDFAKWSGLTKKDSKEALGNIKTKINFEKFDGIEYYFFNVGKAKKIKSPIVHLLSVYDEYSIAYSSWDILCETENFKQKMFSMGNALQNILLIDGRIAGTWKRNIKAKEVPVLIAPLRKLKSQEKKAIKIKLKKYEKFIGKAIAVEIKG